MRSFLITLLASAVLVACDNSTAPPTTGHAPAAEPAIVSEDMRSSETARINEWFDARFEEQLAFSPVRQSILGRKTAYGEIDDLSNEAADKQLAWQRNSVADMQAEFDRSVLSAEAQTSYDIWAYQLEQAKAAHTFRNNEYIFHQMHGPHAFLPQVLISFHPVDDQSDMEAYISRIKASGRAIEQLITRSKENAQRGVRSPHFAFAFVIDEATKLISGAPFDQSGSDNTIWADAQAKIGALVENEKIDPTQADTLKQATKEALLSAWKPAYAHLIAWQQEDVSNAQELRIHTKIIFPSFEVL